MKAGKHVASLSVHKVEITIPYWALQLLHLQVSANIYGNTAGRYASMS